MSHNPNLSLPPPETGYPVPAMAHTLGVQNERSQTDFSFDPNGVPPLMASEVFKEQTGYYGDLIAEVNSGQNTYGIISLKRNEGDSGIQMHFAWQDPKDIWGSNPHLVGSDLMIAQLEKTVGNDGSVQYAALRNKRNSPVVTGLPKVKASDTSDALEFGTQGTKKLRDRGFTFNSLEPDSHLMVYEDADSGNVVIRDLESWDGIKIITESSVRGEADSAVAITGVGATALHGASEKSSSPKLTAENLESLNPDQLRSIAEEDPAAFLGAARVLIQDRAQKVYQSDRLTTSEKDAAISDSLQYLAMNVWAMLDELSWDEFVPLQKQRVLIEELCSHGGGLYQGDKLGMTLGSATPGQQTQETYSLFVRANEMIESNLRNRTTFDTADFSKESMASGYAGAAIDLQAEMMNIPGLRHRMTDRFLVGNMVRSVIAAKNIKL